jgi:glycosyltransferase involved in cell wall biosynthesis
MGVRMKVLFLTQVLPYPLDAGPKVRAYHTLCHLAQQHEVSLLTFVRPSDPPDAVEHLRSICASVENVNIRRGRARDVWHLARSLVGGTPFLIERDRNAEMIRSLRTQFSTPGADDSMDGRSGDRAGDRAGGFDVVHADQLWMAPYALLAARAAGATRRPALVLDQHNAVFQVPGRLARHEANPLKRALLTREASTMATFEARICRAFDHVVWVTAEDRSALAGASGSTADTPNERSSIIPICADPHKQAVVTRGSDARRVTFLGGLHWPPNAEGARWFARDIWPQVRAQAPEAVLTIIGKDPPHALARLGGGSTGLEITGFVPDTTALLSETAAFIVPLQAGGGMRVKILDAWCRGLPVISTTLGAEGLLTRDGENLLLADTPEAFAQAVVRVLREPALAARLAAGGRRTVEDHYDWRRVYPAWDAVYERAVAGRSGRAMSSARPVTRS